MSPPRIKRLERTGGRNFLHFTTSKNSMKRFLTWLGVAGSAFVLGITFTSIWISTRQPSPVSQIPASKCAPAYDATLVKEKIRENDDPDLFRAFQELPLYAMPDCVDEAYSLIWIPSFHGPVLVRVWRVGDESFMTAKRLDSEGWSRLGNIKEINARSLTKSEWREIKDLLARARYWQLSETVDEIIPNDGAVWLLDGLNARQYHWVRRRAPTDQYAQICKRLIQLSGLETAHGLYLP